MELWGRYTRNRVLLQIREYNLEEEVCRVRKVRYMKVMFPVSDFEIPPPN